MTENLILGFWSVGGFLFEKNWRAGYFVPQICLVSNSWMKIFIPRCPSKPDHFQSSWIGFSCFEVRLFSCFIDIVRLALLEYTQHVPDSLLCLASLVNSMSASQIWTATYLKCGLDIKHLWRQNVVINRAMPQQIKFELKQFDALHSTCHSLEYYFFVFR